MVLHSTSPPFSPDSHTKSRPLEPKIFLDGSLRPRGSSWRPPTNFSMMEKCCALMSAISPAAADDNIDPDNMTYEELLFLGDAVGAQSRGLSQERISSLPVSRHRCCLFSRRKSQCVICQMNYKRGDRQITLPCKHVYHAECATRWLSINKVCPVCYAEVPAEKPRRR